MNSGRLSSSDDQALHPLAALFLILDERLLLCGFNLHWFIVLQGVLDVLEQHQEGEEGGPKVKQHMAQFLAEGVAQVMPTMRSIIFMVR